MMQTVPRQEILQRIRNFQTRLDDHRLDGAFILQNADLFYFSGTIQSAVLFVPANGEPILMVLKNPRRAERESSIKYIVPVNSKSEVPNILKDFGFNRLDRAGLEMDVMPASLYCWFQKAVSPCQWTDVSDIIRRLRMIKSAYEIEQIKKATAVLHKGLTQLKSIIREGMTELEIDGHLAMIARRKGQVNFIGHGIGLEIDEYPIISPRFDGGLEIGMVLALEPKFVFPQEGVVGLEDDYVMTSEGLKRLTLTEQVIIQI